MHITAKITFIHVFIRSSNIWPSYILNRLLLIDVFETKWPDNIKHITLDSDDTAQVTCTISH